MDLMPLRTFALILAGAALAVLPAGCRAKVTTQVSVAKNADPAPVASDIFSDMNLMSNINADAVKGQGNVYALSAKDLADSELRFAGKGVMAPLDRILVSVMQTDAAGTSSCYDPAATRFGADCPKQIEATLTADGAWEFALPAAVFAAGGAYVVRFSALTAAGDVAATRNVEFTWSVDGPEAFSITGPLSPTAGLTPTVTWEASKKAAAYDLIVATDAACASPVATYTNVATNSQQLDALGDGDYYVCITAKDAAGKTTTAGNSGYQFSVPPLVCDTGDLRTTCILSTAHRVASGKKVAGPGNLVIQSGGSLKAGETELLNDKFDGSALNPAYTVVAGTWSEAGGLLSQTTPAPPWTGQRLVFSDKVYPLNTTIVAKVRIDAWDAGQFSQIGLGLGADLSENGEGYGLVLSDDGSSNTNLMLLEDGVHYDGTVWPLSLATGTWYWFKMSLQTDTLYGKIWQDGTAEPSGWTYTQTGWAIAGKLPRSGLYPMLIANVHASFDQVTVTTEDPWGHADIRLGGNLTVASGATLAGTYDTVVAHDIFVGGVATGNFPSIAADGNVNVAAGGKIDASAWGATGMNDAGGAGPGGGLYDKTNYKYSGGGGGGHGGAGGDGGPGGNLGGGAHDTAAAPVAFGSAGGAGWYKMVGGSGGGVVRISVPNGTLTADGSILADGDDGMPARCLNDWRSGAGGGAGGSIWLTGKTLAGAGSISAAGGNGGDAPCAFSGGGGGGGGGRVARSFTTDAFSGAGGTISVTGGSGGNAVDDGAVGAAGSNQ